MARQINLFTSTDKHQVQDNKAHSKVSSAEDDIYNQLVHQHLTNKLHIYPAKRCKEILQWYLTQGSIVLDDADKVYHKIYSLKPYGYYHLSLKPLKLYRYNAWIMKMILHTIKG